MIRIIVTFLFLFLYESVFALVNIDFNSDKRIYNIDDNIILNVKIDTDEDSTLNLDIKWTDWFLVVWKKQSRNVSIVNWEKNTFYNLNISLQAPKSWKYNIWPIVIKNWDINYESNIVEIEVEWERIMINNNFSNTDLSWSLDNEEQDLDNIDLGNTSKNILKDVLGLDWELMKNIYPEKWYLLPKIISKESLYFLIFWLLILIIYFIFRKILNKYILINNKTTLVREKKKIINYNVLLKNIEKKYISADKYIFYWKIWDFYRLFIDNKLQKWFSKKSLNEIKKDKNIDISIIEMYEKIYYPEYNNMWDKLEDRWKIIQDIKKIINK